MMKKDKLWTILSIFIILLQGVAEALTAGIILRLNILPGKYMLVVAIVLILLLMLTAMLLFLRGKKKISATRRIIACILALLIVCGCALVSKLAADAYNTIHTVTGNTLETSVRNMYVFVRNEDPAQSLADTKDYVFAIIQDYDVEHTQQAIALIGQVTGQAPVIAQYQMASAMADALLGGQADAMIANGAAITLLMEQEGYEDFGTKVRILHTMPLAELEETQGTTEESTVVPENDITTTPFICYISGSDTRSSMLKVSRSDVNILAIVNPVTKQVLLLNTPRDYYIPNPVGNGARDKLTHCGLYGVDCSMEALGDLYDLEVDYYAQINFTGFETLIDAVGGVTVYSNQSFTAHKTKIVKGENHLNGAEALAFSRERRAVSGGDNGRGKNQMKVIKALIEKITSGTTIISNYSKILDSLSGMFTTDVTKDEISALVKMQLNDLATWNVQTFAVTGRGASKPSYSSPGHNAYVMYPNEDVVEYASELVNRVLAGEILTEEDMKVK